MHGAGKSGAAMERWLGGRRRITRRNFLRIGGVGLAGATLLGVAGCGGGGKMLTVGYNEEPQILNGYIVGGDLLATVIFSANQVPPKGQNYYRYGNQQVAKWLEQSDVTANEDEQTKLLKQVQDQMARDLPTIPLYQIPFIYAYNEKLYGPKVTPTLAGAFWNLGDWSLSG